MRQRRIKVFFEWEAEDLEKKVNKWLADNSEISKLGGILIKQEFFSKSTHTSVGFGMYIEYLVDVD